MKIELDFATTARAGEDVFTLPHDPVAVFHSSTYTLAEIVVIARNGNKEIRQKTKDCKVDLSPLMHAGVLEMTVHLIAKGNVAKKWHVVPIILNEIENEYGPFDLIADLQKRVEALEKKTTIIA